jgi:hypothetical protein
MLDLWACGKGAFPQGFKVDWDFTPANSADATLGDDLSCERF